MNQSFVSRVIISKEANLIKFAKESKVSNMQTETIENFLPLQQGSYGGLRKFVLFYKKNLVRLPEAILKAGVKLITNFRGRLGDECKFKIRTRFF